MTEEKNQHVRSGDVDVNAAASQSTTNSDENGLEYRTEAPGRLDTGTRIFARREKNGKKDEKIDEEGTTPLL